MAWKMLVNNEDQRALIKAKMKVNIKKKKHVLELTILKQLKILEF